MEWLQSLINSETTPVLTAFLLGLLTAISPCPLATNIAAIGYICKDTKKSRNILKNGLLYCFGRMLAYTILAVVLVSILKSGMSMFGLQKFVSTWGEKLLGPALVIMGLLMLFGNKLNMPSFGFKGNAEGLKNRGAWGSFAFGSAVCNGILPYQRNVLLRNAHTNGNCHIGRKSSCCGFCNRNRITCVDCGMAACFQHQQLGKFLRKDEND